MFTTPSLRDSISVVLRRLLQGGRSGSQAVYKFSTKGAGSLNSKIRYQVKEFSFLCMGRCKPLGSLYSLISYAPQLSGANPVSLFTLLLAFPQFLSNHHGGGWVQHPLDCSLRSPHSHLEARNHWLLWHFLFINMAGDIFISQSKKHLPS